MKKLFVFCFLLFVLISCRDSSKKERLNHEYKFQTSIFSPDNTIPVINLKAGNDENCSLVIDTGSEVNVLNKKYYNQHKSDYLLIDSLESTIGTLNGVTIEKFYLVRGVINDSIQADFYVMDIEPTVELVFANQRIRIDGLLGVEFMYNNNIIIDFKNKSITNYDKSL